MSRELSGIACAQERTEELQRKCASLRPRLAVVLAGNDPGSRIYSKALVKSCDQLAAEAQIITCAPEVSEAQLINKIRELNSDDSIDGILLPLPLPVNIDSEAVIETIAAEKDVDGIHPYNLGCLLRGRPRLVPATAQAVMRLLAYHEIPVAGRQVTIVGRSSAVGKPLAALLLKADATVTVCHSRTRELFDLTKKSDIIVTAVGRPEYFTRRYFRPENIVVDVGINTIDGRLCGDVAFNKVKDQVAAITPVPGGVGALTGIMLIENLVKISERRRG